MDYFKKAKRIFLKDLTLTRNVQAGFCRLITIDSLPERAEIRMTGRTFYKVFLNGEFLYYGPARAAHETARVDVLDIAGRLHCGSNALAIELAGYNHPCLSVTGEYSFLQVEVEADGQILEYTGCHWTGIRLLHRLSAVENISHTRCASEVYHLDPDYFDWRTDPGQECSGGSLLRMATEELAGGMNLLPRGALDPDFQLVGYQSLDQVSSVFTPPAGEWTKTVRIMTNTPKELIAGGLADRPVLQCLNDQFGPFRGEIQLAAGQGMNHAQEISVSMAEDAAITKDDGVALDFDFHSMTSGFPSLEFTCASPAVLDMIPIDKLTLDGGFDPRTCYTTTVIRLNCPPGHYRFEAFEPYGVRYMRVIVRGARRFTLQAVYLRRCQYPDLKGGSFLCSDSALNRIYDAARVALVINTLDNFMDCPGRERGAWAMDSFWTGRAARLLFGECSAERAHLENYLAPSIRKYFDLLPGCYPAGEACFIHNWTIFLGLQLAEYYRRTADLAFLRQHEDGINWLVGTLSRYENAFGLLENLDQLVYVDGTTCGKDEYNLPISTGTNAAYAWLLRQLGEILGKDDWIGKAKAIWSVIEKVCAVPDAFEMATLVPDAFAMDGQGRITPGRYSSEAAQYLYMWLGITRRETLPVYFQQMFDQFGASPAVPFNTNRRFYIAADMPVGTAMRFEALYAGGEYQKLYDEITRIFTYMIEHGPGTLWEGWARESNINHGYLSHVAVWLSRIFLGLDIPDAVDRSVRIAPHPCGMKWAKGCTLTGSGLVSVSWVMSKDQFTLDVSVPEGYRANLQLPGEVYGWDNTLTTAGQTISIPARQTEMAGIGQSFRLSCIKAAIHE